METSKNRWPRTIASKPNGIAIQQYFVCTLWISEQVNSTALCENTNTFIRCGRFNISNKIDACPVSTVLYHMENGWIAQLKYIQLWRQIEDLCICIDVREMCRVSLCVFSSNLTFQHANQGLISVFVCLWFKFCRPMI